MKALQFDRTGSLDNLVLREVNSPSLAVGEVLVKVQAAGINPSDVKNVLGRFSYTTLPRIPGRDFSGVVVEGSPEWNGQAVWGSGKGIGFTRDGTHAEYVAVPMAGLSLKPATLSFTQAASCGVPYITALEALDRSHVGKDTRTLIIGAGAVGQAAINLARSRGAKILIAVRNADQCTAFQAQGLASILLRDESSLPSQVQAHFASGADAIFDTTGAWLGASVAALANHGHLAIISTPSAAPVVFPALDFYRRGATLVGVNSLLHDMATCARWLNSLAQQFDAGRLEVPRAIRECSLEDGGNVYSEISKGDSRKTVFVF